MDRRKLPSNDIGYIPNFDGRGLELADLELRHIDIYYHLREQDMIEMQLCSPVSPIDQVRVCITDSRPGYAVLLHGKPIMIFGIVPSDKGGIPWMLATYDINPHYVTFYRETKKFMQKARERYSYLENYVYSKNKDSIRWLKWLGFKFDEPINGFIRFYWER